MALGVKSDYGLAQQNIQARIRGAILMAVSNAEGRLVLATGNKSELSVGYSTLYGDLVGGLAVIGDVYKHDVYALARRANAQGERIPRRTIEKPPSAELAPNQLDSDDLPEYDVLDAILERAIEGRLGSDSITPPRGAALATVREVLARVDRAEYSASGALAANLAQVVGSGRRFHRAALREVGRYEVEDDPRPPPGERSGRGAARALCTTKTRSPRRASRIVRAEPERWKKTPCRRRRAEPKPR